MDNPAAFVMIVESLDKQNVYGGARIHVAGDLSRFQLSRLPEHSILPFMIWYGSMPRKAPERVADCGIRGKSPAMASAVYF